MERNKDEHTSIMYPDAAEIHRQNIRTTKFKH